MQVGQELLILEEERVEVPLIPHPLVEQVVQVLSLLPIQLNKR